MPSPSHPAFTPPRGRRDVVSPWPLRPSLRRRPWGGSALAALWPAGGVELEAGPGPIGEAWLAGPDNRVAAGPDAERRVSELIARHGAGVLGEAPRSRYGDRFPLLLKLLDAAEPLSLQVHPDDAYARRFEAASGHLGKTEAWWVLRAEPGASVWWGFRRPCGKDEVRAAAEAGRLSELLRTLPLAAGDVVVNPAGTVHALGAGLVVFEVQQASDLTYRLDDHGRVGADGRPRALHLDAALAVADRETDRQPAPEARITGSGRRELARTHAFVLEEVAPPPAGVNWRVDGTSFELVTHLPRAHDAPSGTLSWAGGRATVAPFASWLLPAGLGGVELGGGGPYARVRFPHGESTD